MGDRTVETPSLLTSPAISDDNNDSDITLGLTTSPSLCQQTSDPTKHSVYLMGNTHEMCEAKIVGPTEAESANQKKQLIESLRLKVSALNSENDNLKTMLAEKSLELKAQRVDSERLVRRQSKELHSLQQLYEEMAQKLRRLEGAERSWQEERQKLEDIISELRRQLLSMKMRMGYQQCVNEEDGLPAEVSIKGDDFSDELSDLYRHLINLKDVIMNQRRVIKELIVKKQQQKRLQGEGDNSNRGFPPLETIPVYCQHDLDKGTDNHGQDDKPLYFMPEQHLRQISITSHVHMVSGPEPLSHPPILNRNDDVMPMCVYNLRSRIAYPPDNGSDHVNMLTDDSWLKIESNMNSHETSPPSTRRQPREHSPVGATSRQATSQQQTDDSPVKECPVCRMLVPAECSQMEFQEHVNAHFDSEFEVL